MSRRTAAESTKEELPLKAQKKPLPYRERLLWFLVNLFEVPVQQALEGFAVTGFITWGRRQDVAYRYCPHSLA